MFASANSDEKDKKQKRFKLVYKYSSEESASPIIDKLKRGQHICLNINLGERYGGFYTLTALTTDEPEQVAKKFCQRNTFGVKIRKLVTQLVVDKIEQFLQFS